MLKKFALWFICFGLSFLVESWGWAEQGKAFMIIDLGATGLIIAILILICLFGGDGLGERLGIPCQCPKRAFFISTSREMLWQKLHL